MSEGLRTYRWTLEEYVLRVELGDDIREIVVEGVVDRDIIERALRSWDCEARVLEGDFVGIKRDEVETAGFRPGMKGKLLTLATALTRSDSAPKLEERIAVVVDRDYDPEPLPNPFLFLTDGYAIENYALDQDALHRFVEQVLGRTPRPDGAGGVGSDRYSCSGRDLYQCLYSGLTELAGVRLALLGADPEMKPFSRWLDYVALDSGARATVDGARLLENVLTTAGRVADLDLLETARIRECEKAASEPQRWVRSRDFLAVLEKILSSQWGRRRNGKAAIGGDENQLSRFLLFSVDPTKLHSTDLFRGLRQRFCPA